MLWYNFRPTGWDNDKKIAILHENLQNIKPEESFEDVISKPITRKVCLSYCQSC
jgi:dynein light intermediate chain 1